MFERELCGRCGHEMTGESGENHLNRPCRKIRNVDGAPCPCTSGMRSDTYLNLQVAQLTSFLSVCGICGHPAHPQVSCPVETRQPRVENGVPIIGSASPCGCQHYMAALMAIVELAAQIRGIAGAMVEEEPASTESQRNSTTH